MQPFKGPFRYVHPGWEASRFTQRKRRRFYVADDEDAIHEVATEATRATGSGSLEPQFKIGAQSVSASTSACKTQQSQGGEKKSGPSQSLVRRKLLDNVMQGFVIGNTIARSLLRPGDASRMCLGSAALKLLYVGVGDIRNPLCTLSNVPHEREVFVHFNDITSVTLARDAILILLLDMQKESARFQFATAIWRWV
jgi:hypothetical protein